MPEQDKQGGQMMPCQDIQRHRSGAHGEEIPQPQVAAADSESQIQPPPAKGQQKQKIRQGRQPGAQGPEKAVVKL